MKTLPLFPLPLVFFPGAVLPLQIFELRYRRMVKELLADNGSFVMLQALDLHNQDSHFETIGTLSKIIDWQPMANQMIGVQIQGECKVQVSGVSAESDGLLTGRVKRLSLESNIKFEQQTARLAEILTLLERHPLLSFRSAQINAGNAEAFSYQLASLIPFSRADKQKLLEFDNSLQRLEMIFSLLKDF